MLQTITDLQHKQAEFERNSGARERELKDLERRLSERAMAVVAEEARVGQDSASLKNERTDFDRQCRAGSRARPARGENFESVGRTNQRTPPQAGKRVGA
jgi:hypothetical protein